MGTGESSISKLRFYVTGWLRRFRKQDIAAEWSGLGQQCVQPAGRWRGDMAGRVYIRDANPHALSVRLTHLLDFSHSSSYFCKLTYFEFVVYLFLNLIF